MGYSYIHIYICKWAIHIAGYSYQWLGIQDSILLIGLLNSISIDLASKSQQWLN